MDCLVTVCMPTYNNGPFIEEAILSIVTQNFPNIQLIISDDHSTDNTLTIIKKYAEQYPDIITLQIHSKNIGLPKNIESIYPLINGDYVCWFAGDDLYMPGKISTQVKLMQENPKCIFSFHSVNVIAADGRFLYKYNDDTYGIQLHTTNISRNLLQYRSFICMNSAMINYKMAANIKHNILAGPCNDWFFAFELATKGQVLYFADSLVSYRRHQNNITNHVDIKDEEKIFNLVLKHYPHYSKEVKKGLLFLYTMYFIKYILKFNTKMSIYCLKNLVVMLFKSPFNFNWFIFVVYNEIFKRFRLLKLTGSFFR